MSFIKNDRKLLKKENFGNIIKSSKLLGKCNRILLSPPLDMSPCRNKKRLNTEVLSPSPTLKMTLEKSSSGISSDYSFNQELISGNTVEKGLLNFFYSYKKKFINRVEKGPPDVYRWAAWMILARVPINRNEELYFKLINMELDLETDIQISKDITRTMRKQENDNLEIQSRLYRLLKAFAILDNDLSYCQGMNFIFSFFLIASDFNEVETFYLLIAIFSNTFTDHQSIRNLFTAGFDLLYFFLFLFDFYFNQKLPMLYQHFNKIEMHSHVWIGKWFQTIYSHCLNYDALLRLWDYIFLYGIEFMLSFSISLLKYLEKDLLVINDLVEVTEYFKRLNTQDNKLNSCLQIDLNMEDLLKIAKNKYRITKEDLKMKKIEFLSNGNANCFTPTIYNLDFYVDLGDKSNDIVLITNPQEFPTKSKSTQNVRITNNIIDNVDKGINNNLKNGNNDISEDDNKINSEFFIDNDICVTDSCPIEKNIKILVNSEKNPIRFENFFVLQK